MEIDTVVIEITNENAHLFEIELNYVLNVDDYKNHPNRWNTYYLVFDEDGPFLIDPVAFDSKYRFMSSVRNNNLQLIELI